MANINHSTLSDPYLHEPKGVSSALAGQIYVSDGAGSGDWVENSRAFNGYLTFSTSSPYNHSATTLDTVFNAPFTVGTNNGFTGLSSPNARVRYDGVETVNATISAKFSMKQNTGTAKDVELLFYKNGIELAGTRMVITTTSADWHIIDLLGITSLATNDYIEVFVRASAAATVSFASGVLNITGIAA